MTVLAHGTVQRYDHGCDCHPCTHAHVRRERARTEIGGRVQTARRNVAASETFRIALDTYTDTNEHAWRDRAACVGADRELFFPNRGASVREAKAICATCPVRDECLTDALAAGIEHGIWGGKSERERKRIRTGRQVA